MTAAQPPEGRPPESQRPDARAPEAEVPEHVAVFRRLREVFGDPSMRSGDARRRRRATREEGSVPYGPGREPRGILDVVDDLTASRGWESPLAEADLLVSWPDIVGAESAQHTEPIAIEAGVLTVRCDSTAWRTQMNLMRSRVVANIEERHGAAGIVDVRFTGPDTPSWKRGPRAIPGRGPRDTYG
jgi:predicted nucleic acid-binding Zn ribbon protein